MRYLTQIADVHNVNVNCVNVSKQCVDVLQVALYDWKPVTTLSQLHQLTRLRNSDALLHSMHTTRHWSFWLTQWYLPLPVDQGRHQPRDIAKPTRTTTLAMDANATYDDNFDRQSHVSGTSTRSQRLVPLPLLSRGLPGCLCC